MRSSRASHEFSFDPQNQGSRDIPIELDLTGESKEDINDALRLNDLLDDLTYDQVLEQFPVSRPPVPRSDRPGYTLVRADEFQLLLPASPAPEAFNESTLKNINDQMDACTMFGNPEKATILANQLTRLLWHGRQRLAFFGGVSSKPLLEKNNLNDVMDFGAKEFSSSGTSNLQRKSSNP